ncbi:hypothetical protein [Pararhodospirillum oryzae]|uniref:hypothetical protein n=1 Tax=Pararhodospirillum oryzae TaxID=478448 RepID=UPI0011BED9B1|nr:hypothetical protein [Pararhodospirillum oryzae]
MSDVDLFGALCPPARSARSRTARPKGYAGPPGTGPAGETCASCAHRVRGRGWSKCRLTQRTWTCGRGSDVLARAPACRWWRALSIR